MVILGSRMCSTRGARFLVVATVTVMLATGRSATAGSDPLVDAARARDEAAVANLVEQQVDVDATAPDGATALHWAAVPHDPRGRDVRSIVFGGPDRFF